MTLAIRLREQRLAKGKTQQEVASAVGMTQQSFQKIEDGRTKSPRKIQAIADFLECTPQSLLFGTNECSLSRDKKTIQRVKGNYPLINWVQAGAWQQIEEYSLMDSKYFPCPVKCSDNTFVLEVRGISMEPTFHQGELIFVDPDAEARTGKYIVARLDDENEATFKQLIVEGNQKFLKPANPNWPEQLIAINGNCSIVGVVVFVGREV